MLLNFFFELHDVLFKVVILAGKGSVVHTIAIYNVRQSLHILLDKLLFLFVYRVELIRLLSPPIISLCLKLYL